MSNALYNFAKQLGLGTGMNLLAGTVKAALLANSYVFSAAHQYKSAVAHHGTPITLAGKSITNGIFDANDLYFTAVPGGATVNAVAIWVDTGDDATSPMIAYIDSITGFPVATNGGDINAAVDNGAYKLFSL
jgi:hypothetical protein